MSDPKLKQQAYDYSMQDYQSDMIVQENAYRLAELRGDAIEMSKAHKEMAAIRIQMRDAHEMAVEDARGMQAAQQAAPKASKYGLSKDEREAALLLTSDHRGLKPLTDDEKYAAYAKGKKEYANFLKTGKREGADDDEA